MKLATHMLAAALVCLLSSTVPALAQVDVSGDWDVAIQSAQGTNTIRVTFKQDGEKLSGTLKSQMGEMPFENGTISGVDLKFAFGVPMGGDTLNITMTGTVQGPTIKGMAQFGGFGEGEWNAKRVDATTAAAPSAASTPAAATSSSSRTGFNGVWDVTVKTQMGDIPAAANLTENAGKITGTLSGPQGEVELSGTVEGKSLKLAFVAKTPQGEIPVSLSGDLDGDAIVNGKAEFGGMQGEWSARRKQ